MTKPTYGKLWPVYAEKWDALTISNPVAVGKVAARLVAAKSRYQAVEANAAVPWAMIAVIHERESSQDWKSSLAQGDPWDKVSKHVPRGRGPFNSWEDAAMDALHLDGLDQVHDWRLEKILYYLELYNGWGYFYRGIPSPYIFAGSNQYKRGKFTADGKFSAQTIDSQLGCAPMLHEMMHLDNSIKFIRET